MALAVLAVEADDNFNSPEFHRPGSYFIATVV